MHTPCKFLEITSVLFFSTVICLLCWRTDAPVFIYLLKIYFNKWSKHYVWAQHHQSRFVIRWETAIMSFSTHNRKPQIADEFSQYLSTLNPSVQDTYCFPFLTVHQQIFIEHLRVEEIGVGFLVYLSFYQGRKM